MAELPLLVVRGSGPTLMGRDWMSRIRLNWSEIHHLHTPSLHALLSRFPSVFGPGLGTLKGYQAKIHVDPKAIPRFNPARTVPNALRDKVDKELQRLQDNGVLEPVEVADWAAPIVVVLKHDKLNVRFGIGYLSTRSPGLTDIRYQRLMTCLPSLQRGSSFSS